MSNEERGEPKSRRWRLERIFAYAVGGAIGVTLYKVFEPSVGEALACGFTFAAGVAIGKIDERRKRGSAAL